MTRKNYEDSCHIQSVHKKTKPKPTVSTTDLPSLHFLSASSETDIGVIGARAIAFLLLDSGDQRVGLAAFPLAAPVVKDLLD